MSRLMTIQVAEPDLSEYLGTDYTSDVVCTSHECHANLHADTTTTNVHHVQAGRVLR